MDESVPFVVRCARLSIQLKLTGSIEVLPDLGAACPEALEAAFVNPEQAVDVALATNMISVGLDITRLGPMVVQGQPKTAAEYIQATSRVGRDHDRWGLVITVLNLHKPRDRTHYESFRQFHSTFYRAVEATSVTPWAARALDRALAAIVMAIGRHLEPALTPENAVRILSEHSALRARIGDIIVQRAKGRATGGGDALKNDVSTLLEAWMATAAELTANGAPFSYSRTGARNHLLQNPLDPGLANLSTDHQRFAAGRSMRDVEPNVILKVRDPWGAEIVNAGDLA